MQRPLSLVILLFCFAKPLKAQVTYLGCYYPADTRIYSSLDILGVWSNPINLSCSMGNPTHAVNLVKRTGTFKCTASGRPLFGGDEYYYNIINCSIDNFSLLLVVFSAGCGLIFIKKYKFCMIM